MGVIPPSERERVQYLSDFGRCTAVYAFDKLQTCSFCVEEAKKKLLAEFMTASVYDSINSELAVIISDSMGPEKIIKVLNVLDIDINSIEALVFTWFAKPNWIGNTTEAEMIRGLYLYRLYQTSKETLDILSRDFFVFAFDISTHYISKNLEVSKAKTLLNLLLRKWSLLTEFLIHLESKRTDITRDEWVCLHTFAQEFSTILTLKGYKERSASYPLLMDSFVNWVIKAK